MALKNILVGKVNDHLELWESDDMPFEEIRRRVKEQARANKLDTYVHQPRCPPGQYSYNRPGV